MKTASTIVDYVFGLITVAVILKNGPQVSSIIGQVSKSLSMFSGVLLGGKQG